MVKSLFSVHTITRANQSNRQGGARAVDLPAPGAHRRNYRKGPGDQQCTGPPNFLAIIFKKQEISQQVVTRMQDLASEFSKSFRGLPDPHSKRERPPPAPNTQPGLWPGAGRKRPGVGTQTLVPSTFQPWMRPCWRALV